jgi:SAM-dependent methyltransferase
MGQADDAYGRLIYDHYEGKVAIEIVEREDGYVSVSVGPAMYLSTYADWPDFEQTAMGYVHGRVLDIGCGAGRHLLYLQEKGHEATGIDNSPLAITVCRLRGVQDARLMPVTAVSSRLGQYDTILMMCNNFGLMANARRARWLLRRFGAVTGENGRIIASSTDIYQTDDPVHLAYQESNRQRGRLPGQIRIRIRHRQYKGAWFDYLLVSQEEMITLLKDTPWTASQFIEGENGRYVAVLEKKK